MQGVNAVVLYARTNRAGQQFDPSLSSNCLVHNEDVIPVAILLFSLCQTSFDTLSNLKSLSLFVGVLYAVECRCSCTASRSPFSSPSSPLETNQKGYFKSTMPRSGPIRLTIACLFASRISTTIATSGPFGSTQTPDLLPRDGLTCENSTYTQCSGGSFPGNFCCSNDFTCQTINNGKSALCCPKGRDCSVIGIISCDIQQQNATAHPLSQLFTTDLTANLQQCGTMCCPAGMSCSGDSQCTLGPPSTSTPSASGSATSSPSASSPKSSAMPTSKDPSSSSTSTDLGTASTSAPGSHNPLPTSHCNQFSTPGVLVGFFSGLMAGIILALLCICCIGRKRSQSQERESTDLSSVQASVSDPIYNPDASHSYRSDFLRRTSHPSKTSSRMSRASSKMKLYFSRTPTMRSKMSPTERNIPRTPKTPSMRKEPSMESIRIYSPPNMGADRPGTTNTTFAEMMADAGFKEGAPYLGSPGRVDPRSRRIDGV